MCPLSLHATHLQLIALQLQQTVAVVRHKSVSSFASLCRITTVLLHKQILPAAEKARTVQLKSVLVARCSMDAGTIGDAASLLRPAVVKSSGAGTAIMK